MYRIVEDADGDDADEDEDASRVAASGECGGGLGAVAPAVGEDGPQQVLAVVPLPAPAELGEALVAPPLSPTTSISSSSSRTSTMTWGGGGGDGGVGERPELGACGSSTRSGHG